MSEARTEAGSGPGSGLAHKAAPQESLPGHEPSLELILGQVELDLG
jgi:hypothetical protein